MKVLRKLWMPGSLMLVLLVLFFVATRRPPFPRDAAARPAGRPPAIDPDYAGIVLPPNIAPLNFTVQEPGTRYALRLRADGGRAVEVVSRSPGIRIPPNAWRRFLRAHAGSRFTMEILVRSVGGSWVAYQSLTNTISRDPIDRYLVYRSFPSAYSQWQQMGIYQRDLEGFRVTTVLDNRAFDRGCLNCHSFWSNSTRRMSLQVRSQRFGRPLLVLRDGAVSTVAPAAGLSRSPAAYHAWHPDGETVVFSMNTLSLFSHSLGESRDVWDEDSNLGLYSLRSNTATAPPVIADPQQRETWPAWSSQGDALYFCRAPALPFRQFREVRYDLLRVPYSPASGRWGTPEVLVPASATGRSAAEPRESPDGRWLLFCLCDYGNFPAYQPSSDLYVLDRTTGQWAPLAANSSQCDSWHCWSGNGRWIAFASKRRDGFLSRVYFSYFDENGMAHKPFLLPQEDPAVHDRSLDTYNVPELVRDPIPVSGRRLAEAIVSSPRPAPPAGTESGVYPPPPGTSYQE